jgi:hypothetical protein
MATNIMPKNLGENSPIFEATIDHLVPCPHPSLHCQLLGGGCVIDWALYLAGVPMVTIISLNSLVPLKEVGKDSIKNLDVQPLANNVPLPDVNAQPVA